MYILRFLLFPLTILYNLATWFRNHLYNIGSNPSFSFDANVIAVGNLAVGGTGKTPLVTYLIDLYLKNGLQIAVLSRGYGRKTRGFKVVASKDSALTVGDEAWMLYLKYGERVLIAVCEDRARGVPEILFQQPDNDVILLDDAFQHRSVMPQLNILLSSFQRPFFRDMILPTGNLRESRTGARRADIIVITKCPEDLSTGVRRSFLTAIQRYNQRAQVFFSTVTYAPLEPLFERKEQRDKVVGLAAIANPLQFFNDLRKDFDVKSEIAFGDHHHFTNRDVEQIMRMMNKHEAMLVCTEKDASKLRNFSQLQGQPCFVRPMKVGFLGGEQDFVASSTQLLKTFDRDF